MVRPHSRPTCAAGDTSARCVAQSAFSAASLRLDWRTHHATARGAVGRKRGARDALIVGHAWRSGREASCCRGRAARAAACCAAPCDTRRARSRLAARRLACRESRRSGERDANGVAVPAQLCWCATPRRFLARCCAMDEPARPAGFAGFKQRLARSAAGLNALLTDDAVREKAGALLQGRLNRAVERGQAVAEQQLGACRAIAARGLDRAGERKSALSVTTARGAPALSAPVAARSAPRALRVCGTATMRPARRATRLLTSIVVLFCSGRAHRCARRAC